MTLLEVIKRTGEFFEAKGIQNGRLNAEQLVGSALKLKRMQLYLQFERTLSDEELDRIRQMAKRRGQREPLQHIVGEVDFHGLKLKADRRALIPRPETERLVEILIERCTDPAPARGLELGTGGGAIALALAAAWPSAALTAVDLSEEALALARENAAATGHGGRVEFLRSDWFAQVDPAARFELIVANPPYLSAEETAESEPEVRAHEPALALTAAEGGMAALAAIVRAAPDFLAPGGLIALETGIGHHAALLKLASERGFKRTESLKDLTGRDRFVLAWI
jgi:release factor glutamine methyltransferase